MENKTITVGGVAITLVADKSVHKTFDPVKKFPAADLKKVAEALGLPTEPFDKGLLLNVILSHVQVEWFKHFQGKVPAECSSGHQKRIARYKDMIEEQKNAQVDALAARPKRQSSDKAAKSANLYRLADKTAKEAGLTGQRYVVARTLELLGAVKGAKGVTVRAVYEGQKEYEGITKPSDKNVAFHMNKFVHEGIIEQVNEAGLVIGDKADGPDKPKPEPKKKEEAKKGDGKKKQ